MLHITVRGEIYDISDAYEEQGYAYVYYVEDDNQNELGYYDSYMLGGKILTEQEAENCYAEEAEDILATGIIPDRAIR